VITPAAAKPVMGRLSDRHGRSGQLAARSAIMYGSWLGNRGYRRKTTRAG
jgi:hypothetical protein